MSEFGDKIHIVDRDSRRRAKFAFDLTAVDRRAEIYENFEEVLDAGLTAGMLFVHDSEPGLYTQDVNGPVSNGIAIPFALYGEQPSTSQVVDAMLSGAVDYLEWPFGVNRVTDAIARVQDDPHSFSRVRARRAKTVAQIGILSSRERAVLQQIILGSCNKKIAADLGISPRTVEVHRANMLTKLRARSSADAVRIAIYAGLDDPLSS